ncbi:MAG: glycosyltransferase family 39 protein [Solirubrobacterales bacterium]|nr:glycosyltransferase family 39 protein [Solirubrobacterales bacterium]MBV9817616.1 glycosyltransferase family 39 protein [Solirubrobacterales bacterium]
MGPRYKWLLAGLVVVSLVARMAWIAEPCRAPCRSADDHTLIFDEAYYVNAARVIAGIRPPVGSPYANTPLGDDGNSEHPQLAKLLIAGGIELFGDGPLAWRLPSVLLGTVAILGMFALVRAAGGGPWLGLGAAALMACDNLLLVHGRIGTLDIYAVAAMIWGAALYLRDRPILAGAIIGLGASAKEVTPYVLLALAVLELVRWWRLRSEGAGRLARLVICAGASAVMFMAVLTVMGWIAPPYSPQTGKRVPNGPFGHVAHILSYAANQTSPHGPTGIASYPWDWLIDLKPITYLRINPGRPTVLLNQISPAVHFIGLISPPILLLAIPGLLLAARPVVRPRIRLTDEVGLVALAWFVGTYLPFVALSLLESRTSYLYYMVIVMPGIYLAVADLVARIGPRRKLVLLWMAGVVAAAVVLYPFTPLP